jgi:DNA-binding transcriptional LysR family regulator
MTMDLADLATFRAVALTRSMTRAAETLGTVQSNVTQRIRRLEARLGNALFDRGRGGITLTPAGRRLLPYAERIDLLVGEATAAVRDDGNAAGPLRLGSLETTAALRLPGLLAGFSKAYPAVDLSVETGTAAELLVALRAGRVDLAFVPAPIEGADLDSQVVVIEELVLVTQHGAPGVPMLAGSRIKALVLRIGCAYRARLERLVAAEGGTTRLMEFGTIDGILGCVSAGLGITLLPRGVAEPWQRDGRVALHVLPPAEAMVPTHLVRRRDGFASTAVMRFSEFVAAAAL